MLETINIALRLLNRISFVLLLISFGITIQSSHEVAAYCIYASSPFFTYLFLNSFSRVPLSKPIGNTLADIILLIYIYDTNEDWIIWHFYFVGVVVIIIDLINQFIYGYANFKSEIKEMR